MHGNQIVRKSQTAVLAQTLVHINNTFWTYGFSWVASDRKRLRKFLLLAVFCQYFNAEDSKILFIKNFPGVSLQKEISAERKPTLCA